MASARVEAALRAAWRGDRPLLAASLLPLSWLYGAGAVLHRAAYASGALSAEVLGVPVVSVGNLVVGGAGKTPVAAELARRLRDAGRRVAIVSRGYGRASTEPVVVVSDGEAVRATADEGGDEPVWLAHRLPGVRVVVGAKRAQAAQAAVDLGADVIVLDDGLSHHALARTQDVLVVDDELGFGNGRLLPAGPLREPLGAAARASLVWVTRVRGVDAKPAGLPDRPLVRSTYEPAGLSTLDLVDAGSLSEIRNVRVLAACGIARPESFERTLASTGAIVRRVVAFGDHHRFTPDDVAQLDVAAREERCEVIVTTEKDAMRLVQHPPKTPVRALRMDVRTVGDVGALDAFLRRFTAGLP